MSRFAPKVPAPTSAPTKPADGPRQTTMPWPVHDLGRLRGQLPWEQLRRGVVERAAPGVMQPKLAVGAVDSPAEREADALGQRFADHLSGHDAGRGVVAQDASAPTLHRQSATRAPSPAAPSQATHAGAGHALPEPLRAQAEDFFGRGLGHVRVHDDGAAERSARRLDANAYTVGADVVFGAGRYAPSTPAGQRLLGHELTHVVQQSATAPLVQRQPRPSSSTPALSDASGDLTQRRLATAARTALDEALVRPGPALLDALLAREVEAALADAPPDVRAPIEARVGDVPAVAVSLGAQRFDYVAAARYLVIVLGANPVAAQREQASFGVDAFLRAVSEDIAEYLARPDTLADAVLGSRETAGTAASHEALARRLGDYVRGFGRPDALANLELMGTIHELLTTRAEFDAATTPSGRSAQGARHGELARRALLLHEFLWTLRSQGSPAPFQGPLEEALRPFSAQIAALRQASLTETTTFAHLGPDPQWLGGRTARTVYGFDALRASADAAPLTPDRAFPAATERASEAMASALLAHVTHQDREASQQREQVIPAGTSLPEFTQAYHRWMAFFSPIGQYEDPEFRAANEAFAGLYETFGYGGTSGGIARVMLMNFAAPNIRRQLHGASTDFARELQSSPVVTDERVDGSAESVRYTPQALFQVPPTAPGAAPRTLDRDALLALRNAQSRREPGNDNAPIADATLRDGWRYVIQSRFEDYERGARMVSDVRVMPREVGAYLLARQQALASLRTPHYPGGASQPIGDDATRLVGLEAARGTSRQVELEGAAENTVNPSLQDTLDRLRQLRTVGRPSASPAADAGRVTGETARELEGYLDRWFAANDDPARRLTAILQIASEEHGGRAAFQQHLTPEALGTAMAVGVALGTLHLMLDRFGGLGRSLGEALGVYFKTQGLDPVTGRMTVAGWLGLAAGARTFNEARVWGYFGRFILSDLGELIQFAATDVGAALVPIGRQAHAARDAATREPRVLGDVLAAMAPILERPGARELLASHVEAEVAARREVSNGRCVSDPGVATLDALARRLRGVSRELIDAQIDHLPMQGGAAPLVASGSSGATTLYGRPQMDRSTSDMIYGGFNLNNSRHWDVEPIFEAQDFGAMEGVSALLWASRTRGVSSSRWEGLGADDRMAVLGELSGSILHLMGVPKGYHPSIHQTLSRAEDSKMEWDGYTARGRITVAMRDRFGEALGNLLHEARHYYQYWQVYVHEHPDPGAVVGLFPPAASTFRHPTVDQWRANRDNYHDPPPRDASGQIPQSAWPQLELYLRQPLEGDAEGFTRRIMIRLQELSDQHRQLVDAARVERQGAQPPRRRR